MGNYILSIDQGTTSSRAIIFDQLGNIITSAQQEFTQHYPENGWVEHDPEQIWQSVMSTCKEVLKNGLISTSDINSIGITNQRETTLVWNKVTGKTLYNAIVWQDRRTSSYCSALKNAGYEATVTEKTGLLLDPYFSATKVKWILDNVPNAREQANNGELAFGTVDSYLLWRLTDGKSHKTDATNASRTLLFNIHTQQWDNELLALFDIPQSMLPEVMDSSADFGVTAKHLFDVEMPINGVAGDQQAALFGQACYANGSAKSTYGTGCFLMVNTGQQALSSKNKLLTTVGYRLDGKVTYALEGSIFVAGAVIQWLRDGLKIIKNAADSEEIAKRVKVDHGVYLVPAFTGLGAPYWDPDARGAMIGLTRGTGVDEIISAGLQSVCYQTHDLLEAMHRDGIDLKELKIDGGMAANDWMLQNLADIVSVSVTRPVSIETTALGVAFLAGLRSGVYQSLEHIQTLWQLDQHFTPNMQQDTREKLLGGWSDAVKRVLN
jgi:glycerol kinase